MRKGIVIQARMDSTRLRGKVLMDLNGLPMLHHVYNRSRVVEGIDNVIVATTNKKSDDELVTYLKTNQIPYYRGDEDDVLSRFYNIGKEFKLDFIVRITSDNPLFEFEAINLLIEKLIDENLDYITKTKIAYGTNVEVVRFSAIEKAYINTSDPLDKEHVTRYILNNSDLFNIGYLENNVDLSNIRVTVDTELDYKNMSRLYDDLYNGLVISTRKSIDYIKQGLQKIVIGSAQLGFDYGINNKSGYSKENSFEILELFSKSGLTSIDTAAAYGSSEDIIGDFYKAKKDKPIIITKYIKNIGKNISLREDIASELAKSKERLKVSQIDYYFIHHFSDYLENKELINEFTILKEHREISKIGISLYSPDEIQKLIDNGDIYKIDAVQIPFNIIDVRWYEVLDLLKEIGVDVFVRSIFLQGVFFGENGKSLSIASDISFIKSELEKIADKVNLSIYELMLLYPFSMDNIDYLVVGFDDTNQLNQLLKTLHKKIDLDYLKNQVLLQFSKVKEEVLNPALWEKTNLEEK
ncbi:MAG: aldo/keto reductase [Acidaminobacteraceae bacterium]